MNEQKIQRPSSLETRLRSMIVEEILEEKEYVLLIHQDVQILMMLYIVNYFQMEIMKLVYILL